MYSHCAVSFLGAAVLRTGMSNGPWRAGDRTNARTHITRYSRQVGEEFARFALCTVQVAAALPFLSHPQLPHPLRCLIA